MSRTWKALRLAAVTAPHATWAGLRARGMDETATIRYKARMQQGGARMLLNVMNVEVEVFGSMPQEPTLVVSNHIGALDPFIIASAAPMAIVAKAEARAWPLLGLVARGEGVFFVERGRRAGIAPFVREVQRRLRAGVHVLVFAEGHTSPDVLPHPFKTGSFEAVAGWEGGRVVPVYFGPTHVDGVPVTREARQRVVWAGGAQPYLSHLWDDVLRLRRLRMAVHVGEPFSAAGRSRRDLADEAHARVTALAHDYAQRVGFE